MICQSVASTVSSDGLRCEHGKDQDTIQIQDTRYNTICHWEELFETLMWKFQSNKKQLWKRRVYMCTQLWIMNQVCVASRKVASHERVVLCCTVVQLTVMRMTTRMVWNLEKNEGSVEQLERNATVHVLCHLLLTSPSSPRFYRKLKWKVTKDIIIQLVAFVWCWAMFICSMVQCFNLIICIFSKS